MKNLYNNKKKKELNKQIIFIRPKYRYIGDLTNIPLELKQDNYEYIFIIIDHFSKFLGAYLLKNKKKRIF